MGRLSRVRHRFAGLAYPLQRTEVVRQLRRKSVVQALERLEAALRPLGRNLGAQRPEVVLGGFQGDVTNFTAEALSGTSLGLSWAGPVVQDDLIGYHVSWWLQHTNQTNKADKSTRTMFFASTHAVIDGLKPYTTYAIEVIAEYDVRNVKWHGSPQHQLATTKPEGVKNFATLVAEVQPLVKTENNIFEGAGVATTGLSWAPEISGLSDLTVADVTENSALVSWSKLTDFDKSNGAHYNVVLSTATSKDAATNNTLEVTDSHNASNSSVLQEKRILRNVTTVDSATELDKLKPWTNYTVTVTPTVFGDGQLFVGKMQSKDFTTLVAAPGKPRNVTVEENHGGHTLRWLSPESWNGPPGGYEVSISCGEVKGNSTSVTLEADRTGLRLPTLSPNVPCTVGISAYNFYDGEPLDGPRVRVRFTPLARTEETVFEHPTIN
ncbi:hypothetical protein HPB51_011479 [Rhipicephalus microplus]|uniref:Fibronectin type-III domain-containing protein n=1 Tax=Rhipicephalus microplus TaxID=6941 RepID=A0A9J6E8U7_RHIMP|nr:hypothetical protein HPB51_011479 [Rhipicephalus microplus]